MSKTGRNENHSHVTPLPQPWTYLSTLFHGSHVELRTIGCNNTHLPVNKKILRMDLTWMMQQWGPFKWMLVSLSSILLMKWAGPHWNQYPTSQVVMHVKKPSGECEGQTVKVGCVYEKHVWGMGRSSLRRHLWCVVSAWLDWEALGRLLMHTSRHVCWYVCSAFSWLLIEVGEPILLRVAPPLISWPWAIGWPRIKESRPVSSTTHSSYPNPASTADSASLPFKLLSWVPALASLSEGLWLVSQIISFFSLLTFFLVRVLLRQ